MPCIVQFEAFGIQQYIFSSSRLKEIVAGSQMLEALTGAILDKVLSSQGLQKLDQAQTPQEPNQLSLPRQAGGVFLAVFASEQTGQDFARLWGLLVQQIMPGLSFGLACACGDCFGTLIEQVREELNRQKNSPVVQLPESTPISQINRRSGLPAVQMETMKGREIFYDRISWPKHKTQYQGQAIFSQTLAKWGENDLDRFPVCFDALERGECETQQAFPFSGNEGEHYIALVHADGNGMGQYIKDFMEQIADHKDFLQYYARFSNALEQSSRAAAQSAIQWLQQQFDQNEENRGKNLPIRPLILSGDDISYIIRGDYAFGFIQELTRAFEQESQQQLQQLNQAFDVFPEFLTLGAGMVFLRSNQPFYLAAQLSESLCALAKEQARQHRVEHAGKQLIPSTVAFHLVSNSLFEDAKTQIKQELTTPDGQELTLKAYTSGQLQPEKIPSLDELNKIAQCFEKPPSGVEPLHISFIRKLAGMLHQDRNHAQKMLDRWKKLNKTESNYKKLTELTTPDDWVKQGQATPLADLIALYSMNHLQANSDQKEEKS